MPTLSALQKDIRAHADKQRAEVSKWFFKTGKGQYGEGDVFLGLTVPMMRKIAKKYVGLEFADVAKLLQNKIHEYRFIALLILVGQFKKAKKPESKKAIAKFYLKNRKYVNSWDLVDTSAPYILGPYLFGTDAKILYKLAVSKSLWDKRIAIIATQYFIRQGEFTHTLAIAEILVHDTHDLIHKAVGWMLREVGNKSRETEEVFLRKHHKTMPRTMLRYAIEKFPSARRAGYMKK